MTLNHNVRSEDFEGTVDAESLDLGVETPFIPSFSSTYGVATQARATPFSPPFPAGLNLNLNPPGPEQPSSWISPPAAWAPNRSPWTDVESLSSSASTGLFQEPNWNPFEQSLSPVNTTINDGAFVSRNPFSQTPSNFNTYQNGYPNPDGSSYINPGSLHQQPPGPAHFDYNLEQETNEDLRLRQLVYRSQFSPASPLPSPGLQPQNQPQPRTRQPAWGQPRSRGSSSTASSRSHHAQSQKRRKSADPSIHLRSTTSGTYRTNAKSNSGSFSTINSNSNSNSETSGSKTRSNHNQIEKQYRNRLNSQFETLLSILPREGVIGGGEGEGEGHQGVEARKVSKAEVLDMATKHIKKLEKEQEELEGENEFLEEKVAELNRIWVEGGGVVMP